MAVYESFQQTTLAISDMTILTNVWEMLYKVLFKLNLDVSCLSLFRLSSNHNSVHTCSTVINFPLETLVKSQSLNCSFKLIHFSEHVLPVS